MTMQLIPVQTWCISGRSGRMHTLAVWTCAQLGDWASCTIDDVQMVEVTGDAVNRLTVCCTAIANQMAK